MSTAEDPRCPHCPAMRQAIGEFLTALAAGLPIGTGEFDHVSTDAQQRHVTSAVMTVLLERMNLELEGNYQQIIGHLLLRIAKRFRTGALEVHEEVSEAVRQGVLTDEQLLGLDEKHFGKA